MYSPVIDANKAMPLLNMLSCSLVEPHLSGNLRLSYVSQAKPKNTLLKTFVLANVLFHKA